MKGGEENYIILNRESLLKYLRKNEEQLKEMDEIILFGTNIKKIGLGTFNGLSKLKNLVLSFTHLTELNKDTFNGLSNLTTIHLNNSQITKIELGAFNGLSKLKELNLFKNQITELNKDSFKGLNELKSLYLFENQITKIELGTFNGLNELKILRLFENQITKIELGTFNGLSKLEELNLSSNEIAKIELGTFNGLSKLENLYLFKNQITELNKNSFKGLNKLEYLDLSFNKIAKIKSGTFYGLDKLKTLHLYENLISKIELGAFDELISIDDIKLTTYRSKNNLTTENIRSYNKYYYLYQRFKNIYDNRIKDVNETFKVYYNKLSYKYNILREKVYEPEKYKNINIWETPNESVRTNNINEIILLSKEGHIVNNNVFPGEQSSYKNSPLSTHELPDKFIVKKYLINKSDYIHMINKCKVKINNKKFIKLLEVNDNDIKLINNYLKSTNFNNFSIENLLILLKAFDYLLINDENTMLQLFEKIFENIKDFDEEELIKLFRFKRINNSNSLIINNKNKNCEERCKNKNLRSMIIETNNGSTCQCSISG